MWVWQFLGYCGGVGVIRVGVVSLMGVGVVWCLLRGLLGRGNKGSLEWEWFLCIRVVGVVSSDH